MRHFVGTLAMLMIALGTPFPTALLAQGQRPLPEVVEAAELAWESRRHEDALRAYEEIVRRDSTATPALLRLATLLGWRQDFDRAIGVLRQYLRLAPDDADGRVALARTLAWAGRYDESLALYDSVQAANPRHRDAVLGEAQTLAWRGDLQAAISHYEDWLRGSPADADGWVGLAQVRRWTGQPGAARTALHAALAARPGHAEAVNMLPWVDAELSPALEPTVISTNDSDDNRGTTYGLETSMPAPWNARLTLGARYRTADLATRHGTSLTVRSVSSWAPAGGAWTVRGELGATRLAGRDAAGTAMRAHVQPLAAARVSTTFAQRLSMGVGITRAALDETAVSILADVATTAVDGNARITLHPRLTLSASGEVATLRGIGTTNGRTTAAGGLRWALGHGISLTAGGRTFAYDRVTTDGYFAPERYVLAEGSVHALLGGELGWRLDGEAGLGHQRITLFDGPGSARLAPRVSAALGYRLSPAVEWRVGGSFASVASPATNNSANYRAWAMWLGGRIGL